jgi:CelD/BcsL family acetyltransferase involved in cellulose biosynthesis
LREPTLGLTCLRMTERIEWMDTPSRFAAVAEAWEALVETETTPFADHAWFDCWWRAFGDGTALRVCALWRGDDLVAALPLAARRRRLSALANVHSPLFRVPARDPDALLRVIGEVLDSRPDDLRLHGVPVGDATLAAVRHASRRGHRLVLEESQHVSPVVELRGDFASYEKERKSELRELRRRRRKLHREHEVSFVLDEGPADLDAVLDRGFAVEATAWKAERGTAILSSPEAGAFYRGLAHAYRARGELRLASLQVDGRDAAFALCLLRGSRLFLLKQGFDTELRKLAPGLILNLSVIERCFELGYDAYELLGAKEPWKDVFATGERAHERIWTYRLGAVPLGRYAFRRVGLPLVRARRRRLEEARVAKGRRDPDAAKETPT